MENYSDSYIQEFNKRWLRASEDHLKNGFLIMDNYRTQLFLFYLFELTCSTFPDYDNFVFKFLWNRAHIIFIIENLDDKHKINALDVILHILIGCYKYDPILYNFYNKYYNSLIEKGYKKGFIYY